jgi:hypothetical protein
VEIKRVVYIPPGWAEEIQLEGDTLYMFEDECIDLTGPETNPTGDAPLIVPVHPAPNPDS